MALNWNTKLAVSVNGTIVSPIESFSPTLNTGHRVQHSLEADNVGIVTRRRPLPSTPQCALLGHRSRRLRSSR